MFRSMKGRPGCSEDGMTVGVDGHRDATAMNNTFDE
jgi:hypothetical protein